MADVVDVREVTSSNGEVERRYVIRTPVRIGERQWPIEITLTNRESMAYRMLLGRQAVPDDMFVDPAKSFLQPQLGYRVYGAGLGPERSPRPLTVALLSRRPDNASNRRLVRQAQLRGHSMPIIDRRRLSLYIAARDPAILLNGKPLEPVDAVIFRAGKAPSAFSLAIVRQLEMLGTFALNPADALAKAGDALVLRQTLAAARLPVPEAAVNPSDLGRSGAGAEHVLADSLGVLGLGPLLRVGVVGGRSLAMIERAPANSLDRDPEWHSAKLVSRDAKAVRETAEAAVRTLGLGLAAVDIALPRAGPLIVDVTANVSLSLLERLTGASLTEAVIVYIERAVSERVRRSART
jgi:ribosomal protein S6--L-glutamate ligase